MWILDSFLKHVWHMCVVTCVRCHCWQKDGSIIVVARDSAIVYSRTRYTLEIRNFPRFFHEMSVPEGNATYNAENKHGGLERVKTCKIRQIFSTCEVETGIFSTHFNQFCWKSPELTYTNGAILPDLAAISRCIGPMLWHVAVLV